MVLPPWRRTQIEDAVPGPHIEQLARQDRTLILNREHPVAEEIHLADPGKSFHPHNMGQVRRRRERDLLFGELVFEHRRIDLKPVNAQRHARSFIVCHHQPFGFFATIAAQPALHHPVRMGIEHGKVLHLVFGGIGIPDPFNIPDDVAENGVHQPRRFVSANPLDEFHTFVHRGRVGDAFEEKNLVERDAKGVLNVDFGFGEVAVRESVQDPIEFVLPAENAMHNLVEKTLVRIGEFARAKFAVEDLVQVGIGAFDPVEDFDGCSPGSAVEAFPLGCRNVVHERCSGKGRAEDSI